MKAFINRQRKHFNKSILLSLFAILLFASCTTETEFDGDILEAVNADTSSVISFKKDKDSPVAFEKAYTIGINYSASDLPGNDNENVERLNPGFELVGWALDDADVDLQDIFTFDTEGCITAFHMGVRSITLYGAKYAAATDTPYKIIYKTQNKTMDSYEVYDEQMMEGTTSTPEEPSYTDAANNLIDIPGFSARLDLLTEQEILADGSAVVEVLYDRNEYTLTLHKNAPNSSSGAGGAGSTSADDTYEVKFYYDVPKALPANPFTYTGATFAGWATSLEKAAAGTVDYADEAEYTIGASDADLYAVLILPQISVTVELPGLDEVGVEYNLSGNTLTLSAKLPDGASESDYTYSWFYTDEGFGNVRCTDAVWTIDTTSWEKGCYQITLIAERVADGMPSGTTVQITIE